MYVCQGIDVSVLSVFGSSNSGSGLDLNMYFKAIRHFTHPRSSVSVIIKLILILVVAQV